MLIQLYLLFLFSKISLNYLKTIYNHSKFNPTNSLSPISSPKNSKKLSNFSTLKVYTILNISSCGKFLNIFLKISLSKFKDNPKALTKSPESNAYLIVSESTPSSNWKGVKIFLLPYLKIIRPSVVATIKLSSAGENFNSLVSTEGFILRLEIKEYLEPGR